MAFLHRYETGVDGSMHVRRVTYALHGSEDRPARSNLCERVVAQFEGKLVQGRVPGEPAWLEACGLSQVKTQPVDAEALVPVHNP